MHMSIADTSAFVTLTGAAAMLGVGAQDARGQDRYAEAEMYQFITSAPAACKETLVEYNKAS